MFSFSARRRLASLVSGGTLLLLSAAAGHAQQPAATAPPRAAQADPAAKAAEPEVLRLTRNLPGDSKPIVLHADHIATWTEGSRRVILLQGQVLIEQGIVHGRMREAMIWIDLDVLKRSKILHAEVLAEGDVHLEHGAEAKEAPRALLDLNTRGEVKLNAHLGRVFQESYTAAAIYQHAVAERFYTPKDTSAQPVSFKPPVGDARSTTLPSLPPAQPTPAGNNQR